MERGFLISNLITDNHHQEQWKRIGAEIAENVPDLGWYQQRYKKDAQRLAMDADEDDPNEQQAIEIPQFQVGIDMGQVEKSR